MKTYRGVEVYLHAFGTGPYMKVSFTPQPLFSPEK
jgi:hypothetical protein